MTETSRDANWTPEMEALYVSAVNIYGRNRFWQSNPDRSIEGLRMIARRLTANGGRNEFRYASRIYAEIGKSNPKYKKPQ